MRKSVFYLRCNILLGLFLLWGVSAGICLIRHTVINRGKLTSETNRLAWREAFFPVPRGRILSADGIPLAWTELHHDCYLTNLPVDAVRRQKLEELISATFGTDPASLEASSGQSPFLVHRSISPDLIRKLTEWKKQYPELQIRYRTERRRVEYPEIREKLGECRQDNDGNLSGASGLELTNDRLLSGRMGKFHVMLDRKGYWMDETFQIVEPPVPGRDLTLHQTLEEMCRND